MSTAVKLLFWNLGLNGARAPISELVKAVSPDLAVFAELGIPAMDVVKAANAAGCGNYSTQSTPIGRLLLLTRHSQASLAAIEDTSRSCAVEFLVAGAPRLLIFAVHLPSKLHNTDADQFSRAFDVSADIRRLELRVGHCNTIALGDFNMDPFEDGMIAHNGLHAVSDRNEATKLARKVDGHSQPFFYNPSWSLFGDLDSSPPGTFYYPSSNRVARFWHVFDQVLLRPSLIKAFDVNSFSAMSTIGTKKIVTNTGLPDAKDASDHLPITFGLVF